MDAMNVNSCRERKIWCKRYRESRTLALLLVSLGFFLDYTLLTTIVPIIPEFLYNIQHPDLPLVRFQNYSTNITSGAGVDNSSNTSSNSTASSLIDNLNLTVLVDNFSSAVQISSNTTEAQNSTHGNGTAKARQQHAYLMHETVEIGFLSSSKFVCQLLTTPLIGHLIPKYGYNGFMLYGFVSMFLSSIIFAFGETYFLLIIAKCLQGYGAACLSVSGLTMLADMYQDHRERGAAIGISLQGLALGNLIGPLFGGIMYELCGKTEPFLVLAGISFLAICLQLSALKPKSMKKDLLPSSLTNIILDPYIILASVTLMMANMGNTLLESILPIWMVDTMNARRWQQGAIFTPFSVCYLISTYVFGMYHLNIKSWLTAMVGMILTGASFLVIPITSNVYQLISPMAVLGIASGMVESAMLPELGFLVDVRHSAGYATVYAVGDLALCIGDTIAPSFGGILVDDIGFLSTSLLVGFICFAFSPLIYFLKGPEDNEERKQLLAPLKRRKISVATKKVAVLIDK